MRSSGTRELQICFSGSRTGRAVRLLTHLRTSTITLITTSTLPGGRGCVSQIMNGCFALSAIIPLWNLCDDARHGAADRATKTNAGDASIEVTAGEIGKVTRRTFRDGTPLKRRRGWTERYRMCSGESSEKQQLVINGF